MKLFGGLLLILSGTLWGTDKVVRLYRRKKHLSELRKFMQGLKTGIRFSGSSLPELLRYEGSVFCMEAAKETNFTSDPCSALKEAGNRLLHSLHDRELYTDFLSGLGATDTKSQLEHIELYSVMVEERLKEASLECEKKSRLYISLGFFVGLTLFMLIV